MPIDFFAIPCANPNGNCTTTAVTCCTPIAATRFGISDEQANDECPAFLLLLQEELWVSP